MYLFLLETGAELLDLEASAPTASLEEAFVVAGFGLSGSAFAGTNKDLIIFRRGPDMAKHTKYVSKSRDHSMLLGQWYLMVLASFLRTQEAWFFLKANAPTSVQFNNPSTLPTGLGVPRRITRGCR